MIGFSELANGMSVVGVTTLCGIAFKIARHLGRIETEFAQVRMDLKQARDDIHETRQEQITQGLAIAHIKGRLNGESRV